MTGKRRSEVKTALTLRQLRAFLLTAENGSASTAARALGVTQPAVSQQLQELEKLLRVRLMERVGIRMLPTLAGRALIDPIRRALSAIDQIEPTIASFREGDSRLVRLGTGATACIHFLPGPLARTQAQMPNLQILVVTGNTDEIVAAVEDGSIDVALVTGEVSRANPSIHMEPVFEEELVGILPKKLEYQLPKMLRPQDLVRVPLILFEPAGRTRGIINAWFKAEGIRPIPAMELGSIEAIKTLVGAGLGVSLIPSLAASSGQKTIVCRRLVRPVHRHLSLVLRTDKVLDAGLRALLAEIRSAAQSLQPPVLDQSPLIREADAER
ncbi:DNA-binding transcriptional regulator, LysR family [Enhydrobacter aerosaccus]|uniref:DNA-binding transcriptional regulator, LysR family n=1 Tax=Enhydrobacter aerosaccus TaxID=225324 RepID=A0A1T4LTH0_9HYPH|nr:LysR family transcriptional regulator [Enhydrobacter aerosaccus]SJZ58030.1 DNA-binding transcriptional regulator, LysR family [Enhydrobacter aerosaccus]